MATYQPGIVIYSTDGISWIIQKSEYYIASIKSNYILPSPAPPPNTDTLVIACGGGTNALAYSYNGLTWVPSTSANLLFDLCSASGYSGSRWVVIGQKNNNRIIAYSDDGINWTQAQNVTSILTHNYGVNFYNSKWYINGIYYTGVTSIGRVIYSDDNGITWSIITSASSLFNSLVAKIIYNGSIWVACGQTSNRLAYSYDNITWYESLSGNNIFTNNCNRIEYNNNLWVAGGETGKLAYSYNGIDWIKIISPFSSNISGRDIGP